MESIFNKQTQRFEKLPSFRCPKRKVEVVLYTNEFVSGLEFGNIIKK